MDPYGPFSEDVIDRYLNGPELYNVTWESDWAVGYQVGAWFVAYITHHEGEQAVIDFWINTRTESSSPRTSNGPSVRITEPTSLSSRTSFHQRPGSRRRILPSLDRNHHRRLKRGFEKSACPDLVLVPSGRPAC